MVAEIDRLRKANESLGGVFEVRRSGCVPGLGSHVSWEERLDGRAGQAILSIQAVKAVVDRRRARGGRTARLAGSRRDLLRRPRGFWRETNRAGGSRAG